MGKPKQQHKLLRTLYEKDSLERWMKQCKRSCDEINQFLESGKKKKKK
ncbi:MAG: hypothetical protein HFI93_01725 [Lachnospiraceae bacterium]|nr:hypothetical protein [Lachnospiraceae bacterium]